MTMDNVGLFDFRLVISPFQPPNIPDLRGYAVYFSSKMDVYFPLIRVVPIQWALIEI